jgi:hypothetical protein
MAGRADAAQHPRAGRLLAAAAETLRKPQPRQPGRRQPSIPSPHGSTLAPQAGLSHLRAG